MSGDISTEFILRDALFSKLQNTRLRYEAVMEFITNYTQYHPHNDILLRCLSNLYVLVAIPESYSCLKDGEKRWDSFLNDEQLKYFNENGGYILGYILLGEDLPNEFRIIDFIDVRLPGCNLAKFMMDKYLRIHGKMLIPGEIIETSIGYWKKYLQIDYKEDVDDWIRAIDYKYLKWDRLVKTCENYPEDHNELE